MPRATSPLTPLASLGERRAGFNGGPVVHTRTVVSVDMLRGDCLGGVSRRYALSELKNGRLAMIVSAPRLQPAYHG